MKHKTRLLVIMLLGVLFGLSTMSCLKESEKVDLNLGGKGEQCKEDKSCNEGLLCDDTNICVYCIKDEDCGDEVAKCSAGNCVADTIVIPDKCESNADCKEGYECSAGECVGITHLDPAECATNSNCANDKYCNEGVCENRCPEGMAFIPSGEFNMGSDTGDYDEKEVHKVTLTKDFCMDKYEFTNKNKADLMAKYPTLEVIGKDSSGNDKTYQWTDLKTDYTHLDIYADNHPLIGVNWYIAKRICELQGKDLPTEAEWEYSARGGKMTDTDCKFGTKDCAEPNKDNACWSGGSGNTAKTSTCAVGAYNSPNAFGLHDMSGNVWEWVADWYKNSYDADAVEDPKGPSAGSYRVLRGGSWFDINPIGLRTAFRNYSNPFNHLYNIGFRCVLPLED